MKEFQLLLETISKVGNGEEMPLIIFQCLYNHGCGGIMVLLLAFYLMASTWNDGI